MRPSRPLEIRPRQDEAHSMCPVRSCIGLGAVTFPGAYQTLCLAAPQLRVMSPARLCSLSGLAVVSLLSISPPHSLQCYNRPPPRTRRRYPEPSRNLSNYNSQYAPRERHRLLPQMATGLHFPVCIGIDNHGGRLQ